MSHQNHLQSTLQPTRRQLLLTGLTIAGGFAIGLPREASAATSGGTTHNPAAVGTAVQSGALGLTDWVRITRDNQVTLVIGQAEMGQGISRGCQDFCVRGLP